MPVGINSPARVFLLGSSGSQVVTNFFKKIDESASSNYVHEPAGIRYNGDDETYILAGYADRNSPSSNRYGWIERRQEDGTQDWGVELSSTTNSGVYLEAIDTNFANDEIIAVGRADDVPFITKYDSSGDIVWQSSSQTANVTYRGVAIGGEDYYACGSTDFIGLGNDGEAFVEKYDSFGNPGWGKSAIMLGRDVVLNDIATNSRDEVVTVGYLEDDSADKGYIVKLDGVTGKVQWDRTLQLSSINSPTAGDPVDIKATAITIDDDDNIYVVGNIDPAPPFGTGTTPHEAFIVKYSPEGNILWQSMTDKDAGSMNGIYYNDVVVDNVTKKPTVIGRTNDNNVGGQDGVFLTRYNSDGSLSWRREVQEDAFDFRAANASGDGDQSFIYLVFNDDNDTESYVYGKVSATGNGLGDFEYDDGTGTPLLDYITTSGPNGSGVGEKIGRLSDGSVRNDTTDLITYPFNANKILFDDFATQLANKRRQMDSADSFEYSRDVVSQYTTSAAVRPADFQELNLLGDTGFEDETTVLKVKDQSGKGNDGIIPFSGPFVGSGSLNFPGGSTDRLEIANSADFNFGTGAYTIEMFIKTTADAGWLYHENDPNNSGMRLCVGTNGSTGSNDGRIEFNEQVSNNDNSIQGTTQINDGEWHHIAVVRGASGDTTKLYVDGVLDATGSANRNFDSSDTLYIGARGTYGGNEYAGEISNLRVVKGVQVYTGNFTPPSAPLTDLSGTSLLVDGSSITDISSNARTITTVGGITAKNPSPTHDAEGYWEFDGTDDYITLDENSDLANITGDISIEAWFNYDLTNNGNRAIWSKGRTPDPGGGTETHSMIYVSGNNTLVGFIGNLDGSASSAGAGVVTAGQWYHVVLTSDGVNNSIYLDGVLKDTTARTSAEIYNTNQNGGVSIGRDARYPTTSNRMWDGEIGEVRVYPKALSATQVSQNYNATKDKYIEVRANTTPPIGDGIVYNNLLLNYDFNNVGCIEKSSTVIPGTYEIIVDDATTNGAAFGDKQCVAVGYGKVVVGARGETNGVYTGGGKAYIYNATTGALEVTLTPSDISGNDWNFGNAVAICGCSGKIAVTSNSALYLYDADGTNEIIINSNTTLPISPPGGNTFGNGLAISGNKVWVADDNVPQGPNYSGTVYCFNAETGAFIYELRPVDKFDNFIRYGARIAANDGVLAIAAESIAHPVTGRSNTGKVYLYDFNGRNEKILEPNDLTTGALFGGLSDVAIGHGMIVVGASRQQRTEDPQKIGSGEVYVFDLEGTFRFSFRPLDDPADEDSDFMGFGESVAISSDRIIVGARAYVGNPGGVAGRAYQFTHTGRQVQGWIGSGGGDASDFGSSVDAEGGVLVIGAGGGSPDLSGRAYIYPLTGTPSGNIINLSSNSFPGTINGATFNSAGYFEFDGTDDYIQSSSVVAPGSADFSVIMWYKITNTSGRGGLFERAAAAPFSGWVLGQGGTNNWSAAVRDSSNNNATFDFTFPTVGDWTCDAFTWNTSTQTLTPYRNGANAGTATNSGIVGSLDGNTRYPMAIGGRLDSASPQYKPMECGEVQLYSRALTAAEVSQNFNATRGKYGV